MIKRVKTFLILIMIIFVETIFAEDNMKDEEVIRCFLEGVLDINFERWDFFNGGEAIEGTIKCTTYFINDSQYIVKYCKGDGKVYSFMSMDWLQREVPLVGER